MNSEFIYGEGNHTQFRIEKGSSLQSPSGIMRSMYVNAVGKHFPAKKSTIQKYLGLTTPLQWIFWHQTNSCCYADIKSP